jgi:hypothetical protein
VRVGRHDEHASVVESGRDDVATPGDSPTRRGGKSPPGGALVQKMRTKPWWRAETGLVVLALVAGLTSGAISHASRAAYEARLGAMYETAEVVVAARDLAKDTVLTKSMLRTTQMLRANVTSNIVTPKSPDAEGGTHMELHETRSFKVGTIARRGPL